MDRWRDRQTDKKVWSPNVAGSVEHRNFQYLTCTRLIGKNCVSESQKMDQGALVINCSFYVIHLYKEGVFFNVTKAKALWLDKKIGQILNILKSIIYISSHCVQINFYIYAKPMSGLPAPIIQLRSLLIDSQCTYRWLLFLYNFSFLPV